MRWSEVIQESDLSEINRIDDFPDEIVRQRMDNDATQARLSQAEYYADLGELQIFKGPTNEIGGCEFFLKDQQGKLMGKVTLGNEGHSRFNVMHIWFDPSIRNKGYGYQFYAFLLNRGIALISDYSQTSASKAVWKKLISNFNVFHYSHGEVGERVTNIEDSYIDSSQRLLARK